MFIGKRLKELRLKNNLTQQELGNLINVTKVSVCCYEKGTRTPNIETLEDLCNVLNVNTDYLLGRDINVMVMEDEASYGVKLSKNDIDIINEIKKHKDLYRKITNDPKRMIDLINKKIS
jgi:transcriptional regulator with XRE-family HTH domain